MNKISKKNNTHFQKKGISKWKSNSIWYFPLLLIIISFVTLSCSNKVLVSNADLLEFNYQEIKTFSVTDDSRLPKADINPKYPDGLEGLLADINKTIKYPQYAIDWDVEGEVVVEYIIEIDGRVKNISISKSVSAELDHEAKRVIKKLKKWYPGIKDGKPVRVLFRQPISFKLN